VWSVRPVEERGEKLDAVPIGPLQVVDEEDERRGRCDRAEEAFELRQRVGAEACGVREVALASGARGDRGDPLEYREDRSEVLEPGRHERPDFRFAERL
jgi:hypothetical protein